MVEGPDGRIMEMTVKIVASYVANNSLDSAALPELIRSVHSAIARLSGDAPEPEKAPEPAVSVAQSVTPEFIICLEDGRKLKMLKRYLRTRYDMSPEDYRAKWNLPADYPMVAPNYARLRSKHAKQIGLGKKK
jgi:predicted transcriptional regulator